MTLFELLVVLTILAILSTVAVVSTETVISRGRFEATERTLLAIEEAILGPDPYLAEDGALATSGFVADMGRLPGELSELWERGDLWEFDFVEASTANLHQDSFNYGDPEVIVPSGWRGPYLRLPFRANTLRDGWGKEFEFDYESPSTGIVKKFAVRSDGPDGPPPGDPDAFPQELVIVDQTEKIDLAHTTIQVTVWQEGENCEEVPSGTGDLIVRLFGPKEGLVFVSEPTDGERHPTGPKSLEDLQSAPVFHFYDVPIGPHVIRAYVRKSAANPWEPRTAPLPIEVHPSRSTSWKLVLPPDSTGAGGDGTNNGDENNDNPEED